MNAEILLFQRLQHVRCWFQQPEKWLWMTPGRQVQGPALHWEDRPGLANLLWLALDMEAPPTHYDARYHQLYTTLVLCANKMTLGGEPLIDQADSQTLAQFRNLCKHAPFVAPAPVNDIAPLLALLATGRLVHAHT